MSMIFLTSQLVAAPHDATEVSGKGGMAHSLCSSPMVFRDANEALREKFSNSPHPVNPFFQQLSAWVSPKAEGTESSAWRHHHTARESVPASNSPLVQRPAEATSPITRPLSSVLAGESSAELQSQGALRSADRSTKQSSSFLSSFVGGDERETNNDVGSRRRHHLSRAALQRRSLLAEPQSGSGERQLHAITSQRLSPFAWTGSELEGSVLLAVLKPDQRHTACVSKQQQSPAGPKTLTDTGTDSDSQVQTATTSGTNGVASPHRQATQVLMELVMRPARAASKKESLVVVEKDSAAVSKDVAPISSKSHFDYRPSGRGTPATALESPNSGRSVAPWKTSVVSNASSSLHSTTAQRTLLRGSRTIGEERGNTLVSRNKNVSCRWGDFTSDCAAMAACVREGANVWAAPQEFMDREAVEDKATDVYGAPITHRYPEPMSSSLPLPQIPSPLPHTPDHQQPGSPPHKVLPLDPSRHSKAVERQQVVAKRPALMTLLRRGAVASVMECMGSIFPMDFTQVDPVSSDEEPLSESGEDDGSAVLLSPEGEEQREPPFQRETAVTFTHGSGNGTTAAAGRSRGETVEPLEAHEMEPGSFFTHHGTSGATVGPLLIPQAGSRSLSPSRSPSEAALTPPEETLGPHSLFSQLCTKSAKPVGSTVFHLLCYHSIPELAAAAMLSLLLRRIESHPSDLVDWDQKNKKQQSFIVCAAHHQRLSLFWPLLRHVGYFAAHRPLRTAADGVTSPRSSSEISSAARLSSCLPFQNSSTRQRQQSTIQNSNSSHSMMMLQMGVTPKEKPGEGQQPMPHKMTTDMYQSTATPLHGVLSQPKDAERGPSERRRAVGEAKRLSLLHPSTARIPCYAEGVQPLALPLLYEWDWETLTEEDQLSFALTADGEMRQTGATFEAEQVAQERIQQRHATNANVPEPSLLQAGPRGSGKERLGGRVVRPPCRSASTSSLPSSSISVASPSRCSSLTILHLQQHRRLHDESRRLEALIRYASFGSPSSVESGIAPRSSNLLHHLVAPSLQHLPQEVHNDEELQRDRLHCPIPSSPPPQQAPLATLLTPLLPKPSSPLGVQEEKWHGDLTAVQWGCPPSYATQLEPQSMGSRRTSVMQSATTTRSYEHPQQAWEGNDALEAPPSERNSISPFIIAVHPVLVGAPRHLPPTTPPGQAGESSSAAAKSGMTRVEGKPHPVRRIARSAQSRSDIAASGGASGGTMSTQWSLQDSPVSPWVPRFEELR